MSDKTIKITKSILNDKQPSQSYLVLDDGGLTVIEPRDVITWEVEDSDIKSILIQDDKSINLFVPDPAPIDKHFKKWRGTVRSNLTAGEEENYRIYWSENDKVYSYDPKIQVNT